MKKKWFKIIITVFVLYAIFINAISGLFDLLNKDRTYGFYLSLFETDLPNLISMLSMVYLLFLINKRDRGNG